LRANRLRKKSGKSGNSSGWRKRFPPRITTDTGQSFDQMKNTVSRDIIEQVLNAQNVAATGPTITCRKVEFDNYRIFAID